MSTVQHKTLGGAFCEVVEADEKLRIKVFINDVSNGTESVPCWTFVTNGLAALGQKELVFALRRIPEEDEAGPPWDIRSIFTAIFALAEEKKFVDVGDMSLFRNDVDGLFGHTEMIGFAYIRPEPLPGVELPDIDSYLLVILLVPGAPDFANKFGAYRITSRLGRNAIYFPSPPCSDRMRESTISAHDWHESILSQIPSIHMKQSSLRLPYQNYKASQTAGEVIQTMSARGTAILNVHANSISTFMKFLEYMGKETDKAVAIVLKPDSTANMQLTWLPDDSSHKMNISASSVTASVTGGFLALAVGPELDANGSFVEDGFCFTMSTSTWSKLYSDLKAMHDVELPAAGPGGLGLSIQFPPIRRGPWWKFW